MKWGNHFLGDLVGLSWSCEGDHLEPAPESRLSDGRGGGGTFLVPLGVFIPIDPFIGKVQQTAVQPYPE